MTDLEHMTSGSAATRLSLSRPTVDAFNVTDLLSTKTKACLCTTPTMSYSDNMGTSRKEQLSLLDFKLDIVACLCEIRTKSEAERETYSIETQLNIKRRRGAVPIPRAVRTDQTDH